MGGGHSSRGKGDRYKPGMRIRGLNGNAWRTIVGHIDETPLGRNTILCIQEHKLSDGFLNEISASCFARHLTVGLTPATTGPGGGRVAGVGFVVPRCLGLTYLEGVTTFDFSPPGSPGRLAAG